MIGKLRSYHVALMFLCIVLGGFFCASGLDAKGMWSTVSVTKQKDTWDVDQTISYSTHGVITSARAVLRFTPAKESDAGEQVRDCLDQAGIDPRDFTYYLAFITVDCRKGLLHFSRFAFFDAEDNIIWDKHYEDLQQYLPTEDSSAQAISWHLCLNRPGFFDSLKKKKPFLYFFSKRKTAE